MQVSVENTYMITIKTELCQINPGKYYLISSVDCGLSGIYSGHVSGAALSFTSVRELIIRDTDDSIAPRLQL